jgi:predicted phage terminase large subunit-like protein
MVLRAIREEKARRKAEAERRQWEEDAERIRLRCQTLLGFIREFWPVLEPKREFKSGWAIEAMCEHLEAVTAGEIKRLLMTVPPGMMKSLLLVFWTAWEWGPMGMPHLQVLATSYSQANVLRDNQKLRRLIESEKFRAVWPLELRADQNAKGKFENTANGFSEARPFSSMTGGRGDRVKIDDPHSTETAESDTERATATRIFREGITDRLNDVTESAIVIIMQRLHAKDVAAVALELDIGFVHLNLPMRFECERTDAQGKKTGGKCRTYVDGELFFEDPREVEGELLFPERFPDADVRKLEKAKGSYAWAGQYQQRPAPRDGGLFERVWFKMINALPAGPKMTARAWDIGATEGGGDPSAGVRCTRVGSGEEAQYVFTHCTTGQWSPAQFETELKATAAIDTTAVTIRLPQDPGAAGKGYARTLANKLPGFAVKIRQPTGSKVTRATALATAAEIGNVYILATGDPHKDAWIEPFIDELCAFPTGSRDDQVDAAADAFNELAAGPSVPALGVGSY